MTTKNNSFYALRSLRIGLIIIVIILSQLNREHIAAAFSNPIDIYNEYPDDYYNVKAVKTQLGMLVDVFCKKKTLTGTGRTATSKQDYYYIVPVYIKDDSYPYYIGVKVPSEKSMLYDKAVFNTWEYLNSETDSFTSIPISFEGGLFEMNDELYQYYKKWFVEHSYFKNDNDMKKYMLPLLLEPMNYEQTRLKTYIMGAFFIFALIMIIISIRRIKNEPNYFY